MMLRRLLYLLLGCAALFFVGAVMGFFGAAEFALGLSAALELSGALERLLPILGLAALGCLVWEVVVRPSKPLVSSIVCGTFAIFLGLWRGMMTAFSGV